MSFEEELVNNYLNAKTPEEREVAYQAYINNVSIIKMNLRRPNSELFYMVQTKRKSLETVS